MLDATFVEKISELTRASTGIEELTLKGRTYAYSHAAGLKPILEPEIAAVQMHTLSGLVDFIEQAQPEDPDGYPCDAFVQVDGPRCVSIRTMLVGDFNQRMTLAQATLPDRSDHGTFRFGHWYPVEDFVIMLMAQFASTEDKTKVLKLVGNIKEEAVRTSVDDGVSQFVTARTSVTKVENVEVPNPVMLAPFRTFREIDQPQSPFILRLRGQKDDTPQCALFEADGGAWELAAIEGIANWLKDKLGDKIRMVTGIVA